MNTSLDGVLIFRLPGDVRAALDKAAASAGEKRSAFARRVLVAGLASIRPRISPDPDGGPLPSASSMQAAA